MTADARLVNAKQLSHSLLGTPKCFVLYNYLHFAVRIWHIVEQKLNLVTHLRVPSLRFR